MKNYCKEHIIKNSGIEIKCICCIKVWSMDEHDIHLFLMSSVKPDILTGYPDFLYLVERFFFSFFYMIKNVNIRPDIQQI